MADLSINFAGIKSPNPFWLASAPPTNMGSMVERTADEYAKLFAQAGFKLNRIVPTKSPFSVIEAVKG